MKKTKIGKTLFFVLIFIGAITSVSLTKVFLDTQALNSKKATEKVSATTTTDTSERTSLATESISEQVVVRGVIKKENGEFTLTEKSKTYMLKSNIDLRDFVDKEAKVEGTLTGDYLNIESLEVDGMSIKTDDSQVNIQTQNTSPASDTDSKSEVKTETNISVNGETIKVTPTTTNSGSTGSNVFIEGNASGNSNVGDINVRIHTSQNIDSNSRVRIRTK